MQETFRRKKEKKKKEFRIRGTDVALKKQAIETSGPNYDITGRITIIKIYIF